MSLVTIFDRYGVRGGTAADLALVNEIPLIQELIYETDTLKYKLGDGVTQYNDLAYAGVLDAAEIPYDNTASGLIATDVQDAIDEVAAAVSGGGGGGGAWTTVKKTSDETRNTTATLASDSTLKAILSASTRYHIRGKVFIKPANATMDYQWAVNYSGTVTRMFAHRLHTRTNDPESTDGETTRVTDAGATATIGPMPVIAGTFGVGFFMFDLVIQTNSSGTFAVQWAQNTSNAGNISVLAGSYLEYMPC